MEADDEHRTNSIHLPSRGTPLRKDRASGSRRGHAAITWRPSKRVVAFWDAGHDNPVSKNRSTQVDA
jgi:hypothetical protein